MSADERLSITISCRGTQHIISYTPETTIAAFQVQLEDLTNVPPSFQKLLHKGKNLLSLKSGNSEDTSLSEAGFKNGMKVQLLGSTTQDLSSLQSAENEQRKRERIMRERALKAPVKVRNTGSTSNASFQYRFHQLVPLPHLPNPGGALSLLSKLSEDPAIKHIMQKHQFSVGVLTELAPHEHPELLGLNVNAGQAIKLRLRTDRYDGFRIYADVRKVLCHELTHNVWGDHDNNFKELNSKLNREVAAFETAQRQGTHYLSHDGDFYEPSSELEAEAQTYILGGGGQSSSGPAMDESREERRRRLLDATMARLQKEEEDLEQSCGTKGSTAHL